MKQSKREKRWGSKADYMEVCREIWEERNHACERCGRLIQEPRWHNFNHKEGRTKNFMNKDTIELVCFVCHSAYHGIKEKNGEWLDNY